MTIEWQPIQTHEGRTLYLSGAGNDATGDGSPERPYRTLRGAAAAMRKGPPDRMKLEAK